MTDDLGRTDALPSVSVSELRGEAYLLAGDAARAEALAGRVLAATRLHIRQCGSEDADEFARAELVRSFVADPGLNGAAAGPPPGDDADRYEAAWRALTSLSPRRRAVIVLRYHEGLSDAQIARRLGILQERITADADASLLTLRTALRGYGRPQDLVPAVLAKVGRDQSASSTGRASPAKALSASPSQTADVSVEPDVEGEELRRGIPRLGRIGRPDRRRPLVGAGAVAAAFGVAAALFVPVLRDRGGPTLSSPAATSAGQTGGAVPPSRPSVVPGLLAWPARGPLRGDQDLRRRAMQAWQESGARADTMPATDASILYAGDLDGHRVVLLQAVDRAGLRRVAELAGPTADDLRLVRSDQISGTEPALAVVPAGAGDRAGRVRVIVAPGAPTADGLLASADVTGMPLRQVPLDEDGLSQPLPVGAQGHSHVVVLAGTDGQAGPRVLGSGTVGPDRLTPAAGRVEIGAPSVQAAGSSAPDSGWFRDGAALARKIDGGPVVVAALRAAMPARSWSAGDHRLVGSQVYEVRRGTQRWIGSVVRVDGLTACVNVTALGSAGVQRSLAAFVARCPLPGTTAGVLQIVAGPGAQSVRVSIDQAPLPPFRRSISRPAGVPPGSGFATAEFLPSGFPCGAGTVSVTGDGPAASAHLAPWRG